MNRLAIAATCAALASVVLLATTTPAQASGYASAAMKQIECGQAGERAAEYKRKGTIDGFTVQHWVSAINQDGKQTNEEKAWVADLSIAMTMAALPQVKTPQDAHMAAWARCMDN